MHTESNDTMYADLLHYFIPDPWRAGEIQGDVSAQYPADTVCHSAPRDISVISRFRVILGVGVNSI
jgi:hypothetical protein